MCNTNNQIKFKTSMLSDYSGTYILVSGTAAVTELAAGEENYNMQVVFKSFAPFTNCISKINNTQIDNAKDIDVVMPMYSLIEYSDNKKYLKVYINTIEINQLCLMMLLLIFLVIVFLLNLKRKK